MGQKGSRFVWSGREADRKDLFAGEKSPFTNPCKLTLFCSPKVNISQFLMESLHYGEMLGGYYINSGFYWGSTAGIYCDILGRVCSRLSASRSHRKVTVCTPRRRGVPFTRVRRRGLCSISGCYPYGIDNPPTLRRSSFPQRALRPAGDPIPKHAWGYAPRPPFR